MAKLIAGASIASTAGDTPPNGSNLPTDPMNKVQGKRYQEYAGERIPFGAQPPPSVHSE